MTSVRSAEVVLVAPPFTDTNGPYGSLSHLSGFLEDRGVSTAQVDIGIDVLGHLLSATGLTRAAAAGPAAAAALEPFRLTIDDVMRFLRGGEPALALRLVRGDLLGRSSPATTRSTALWAVEDEAKLRCGAYLRRLEQVLRSTVDDRFSLTAYGAALVDQCATFRDLDSSLVTHRTIVTDLIAERTVERIGCGSRATVGITVPFAGSLPGALAVARAIRDQNPDVTIVLGGGWINTELRNLCDPSIFDLFDLVTLDDGYIPLLRIAERQRSGAGSVHPLERTFSRDADGYVRWHQGDAGHLPHADTGGPSLQTAQDDCYFPLFDVPNVVHRLWGDWCWTKVTVSQGCYWRRCSFCDIDLDYVGRYERVAADRVAEWMGRLVQETGRRQFHFVDEALSPRVLRELSARLVEMGLNTTWWGNIRFEPGFTDDVVDQMASAGCVAVTGGLESPVDRLLALVDKGIDVASACRTIKRFAERGILVHAYLMYGLPDQTLEETIDGLEVVRQLFALGWLHNAHWHCFSLTRHSPFGHQYAGGEAVVQLRRGLGDLEMDQPEHPARAAWVGDGLRRSLAAYRVGEGLDRPLATWFERGVPTPSVTPNQVRGLVGLRDKQ